MLFAVATILQAMMEQSNEVTRIEPNRLRDKASPATSSESDKGVDLTEHRPLGRKRHRRGKHRRKWKPYSSMTWEEKRAVEAKEAACAARKEALMAGKPTAPWNTTQFLMEDRGCNEVQIPTPRASRTLSLDDSLSEEELYESPEDDLFEQQSLLEQDYESTYQQVASERLADLSKSELIDECLQLERELNSTREQAKEAKEQAKEDLLKMEKERKKLQTQLQGLEEEKRELCSQLHPNVNTA